MKVNEIAEAEILVQKIPSDMGIHRNPRKGTLNAPEKILEDFEFESKVLVDEVFPDEFDLEETQRRIEKNTSELADAEKPIISIGGDHSVSFPVIKALKEKNPGMQLVWLDAHLDVKEKVGDHVSHDVVVRELLNQGFSEDEVWIVGYTRIDGDEKEFLEENDIHLYSFEEINRFKREFGSNEQPVYMSIDIDVLKEEIVPGTDYPHGKLDLHQVKEFVSYVDCEFADLVEVAPPFDRNGKTVSVSRKILERLVDEKTEKGIKS